MNNQRSQEPLRGKIITGIIVLVVIVVGALVFLNMGDESIELTGEVIEEEVIVEDVRPFHITTLEWEPHIYTDEEGVVRGIGVDVLDRIFSKLEVPYEIKLVPWARALREVESGEADAILFTAYTPERNEFLYYTEEEQKYSEGQFPPSYVTISDPVFFMRKLIKNSITFESLEDIRENKYRVGVISGYSSAAKLYDAQINIIEYPDPENAFQGLIDGEVDMYLQEKAVGFSVLKRMGLGDTITVFPLSFFTNPQYIPFSKQSDYPDLLIVREKFLNELRRMHESGEYEEIYNKYVNE
jgi:polar amino acid transport system substrate-binding protein